MKNNKINNITEEILTILNQLEYESKYKNEYSLNDKKHLLRVYLNIDDFVATHLERISSDFNNNDVQNIMEMLCNNKSFKQIEYYLKEYENEDNFEDVLGAFEGLDDYIKSVKNKNDLNVPFIKNIYNGRHWMNFNLIKSKPDFFVKLESNLMDLPHYFTNAEEVSNKIYVIHKKYLKQELKR